MALSKAVIPYTIQDEQVTAQHFLICCTEDCENSCQFYCNPCYKPMCEECRDKHQKTPETKYHEVVPYRDRKQKLPVEKCKDHPSKDIDIICENCQIPLCSKCAIRNHRGHKLDDLETVYSDRFTIFVNKICDIHQYLLPISQNMQKDIKEDTKEIKEIMDKIRTSIKIEAEYLKQLTDMVMTDNLEQVKKIEQSLIKELRRQDKNYENYNSYLEDLIKDIHGYLSFDKVTDNPIIFSLSEHLKTKPIPETKKPVYPVFTAGQNSKDDVANLFGRITAPNTKPEKRKIKSIETASAQLKFEEKQKQLDREKVDVKQALLPSCSVTKVRQYTVPGVERVYHISVGQSGRLWASDNSGKLIQTDLQGRYLQILASCGSGCYHTVTLDDDLIYTDKKKNVINRIALDYSITKFITIGDWEPISIHSSHINEDVLVGIRKYGEGQVTRYYKKGEEIQNIQTDNEGQKLYSQNPHYITENVNCDVCVSDFNNHAVVVVNKTGQHRFSYTGQKSEFRPFGICTDVFGHIIVCDANSKSVHLLDQDGHFLSLLITTQQRVKYPRSVCLDESNNLHVGQSNTNTMRVFKYLMKSIKKIIELLHVLKVKY